MNSSDQVSPILYLSVVVVEEGEVQWTISVALPWLVDEGASDNIDHFDAQALEVVQVVHETLSITTVAELIAHPVMLEIRAVGLVVGGIAIGEAVEGQGVEGHSPVVGRGMVSVVLNVFPRPPVIKRVGGGLVLVQVPA